MHSLFSWLTNAQSAPLEYDGAKWIAATYEDWEKRRPCGTKNPISMRQLRDLVEELVKDGWLLKSRHRSHFHRYRTVLHLALSPSFHDEIDKWAALGPEEYRKQRAIMKPTGSWSSLCWQWVVTPPVTWSAAGRHLVVNSYKSLIVGKSENQSRESEWRFPVNTGTTRLPGSALPSGEEHEHDSTPHSPPPQPETSPAPSDSLEPITAMVGQPADAANDVAIDEVTDVSRPPGDNGHALEPAKPLTPGFVPQQWKTYKPMEEAFQDEYAATPDNLAT